MKTKSFFSTLLIASLLALNHSVAFHGDEDGDSHEQECDIDGNETLHAKVVLVATTNAPEGASGIAKLEAENEDGVLTTELEIKTEGLPAGDYFLSAIRISDGSSVSLGQITLSCSEDEDEDEDEDHDEDEIQRDSASQGDDEDEDHDEDEDEDEDHNGGDCECNETTGLRSESEVTLPPDLDPMDISQIILSDAAGNALLVGDFVNPVPGTTIKFKACIQLVPETGAPSCHGTAQVLSTSKKGKHKNRFTMVASGVPANSTLNVQMNGTPVGSVKSNKKGKVLVKKLPANLRTVRSVELMDSQGQVAASAKF